MQNYRFLIEYDGTRYNGWQRLKGNDNTIQGKLETVLSRMTGQEVQLTGAGRTDAGVHARGQVANAFLETDLSGDEIRAYMNHYLPEDIRILSVEQAGERFHSRFCARGKLYCYYISTGEKAPVFERKFLYHVEEKPDPERMRQAAAFLTGSHDFRSFCGNRHMKKSRPGTLIRVICREEDKEALVRAMFRYTSTIGIRETSTRRYVLDRQLKTLETEFGPVQLKTSRGYGISRSKYEYEDLARIAREKGLSLEEVLDRISRS